MQLAVFIFFRLAGANGKSIKYFLVIIIHATKVSSGFEYFLLIFSLRLGLIIEVVGLDAELNSLSNGGIFSGDIGQKTGF